MLAADYRPFPVRAAALQFSTGATLDSTIETVIASVLGQFVANWPVLTETRHLESIHQLRVALRRLRTALAFFDRCLPCAEFGIFRAEAKRIASALAPARDLDAFRQLIEDGPRACYAHEGESFEALLTTIEDRRMAAYAIAQNIIEDPSTTRFVLKLRAFLAHKGWRNALSGAELLRLTEPATPQACVETARGATPGPNSAQEHSLYCRILQFFLRRCSTLYPSGFQTPGWARRF